MVLDFEYVATLLQQQNGAFHACHPTTPDIVNRLDALAKITGSTKNFYIREAILQHLDNLEDLYLAERELEEVRAGQSGEAILLVMHRSVR